MWEMSGETSETLFHLTYEVTEESVQIPERFQEQLKHTLTETHAHTYAVCVWEWKFTYI